MQVWAILVNYKNTEMTIRCLQALEKGSIKPEKVYIIDNAATQESQAVFKAESHTFPVEYLKNSKNVGFAAACNQGIKAALASGFKGYIWLLNNDTEPQKSALEKIKQKAEETHAGITGSLIVDKSGKYIGGVGIVNPFFASVKRPSSPSCENFNYIEGASFLISPDCLEKVGLLSEIFFLYFEESDYCYRAQKAGFTLAWATESIITHHIGSSTGSEKAKGCVPFFIDCLMIRNRIQFALRNGFSKVGVGIGFLISLAIRIKRGQLNRVLKIISICLSSKRLKKFIEVNGGSYEIH